MSTHEHAFRARVALGACSSHVGTLLRFQLHTPTRRYVEIVTLDLHARKHIHVNDYQGLLYCQNNRLMQ